MKEIIKEGLINKEDRKKYRYYVDNNGNLVRKKYSYFKEPSTYIVLFILVAGFLYLIDVKTCHQTLNNLPYTCDMYQAVKNQMQKDDPSFSNLTDAMNEAIRRMNNLTNG